MGPDGNIRHTLDDVLPLVESLAIEEKAKLIQRLIGKHSGLNVVIEDDCLSSSVVGLVKLMSRDEIGETLIAIANRIILEGNGFRG
jgi:hypothetical protein